MLFLVSFLLAQKKIIGFLSLLKATKMKRLSA